MEEDYCIAQGQSIDLKISLGQEKNYRNMFTFEIKIEVCFLWEKGAQILIISLLIYNVTVIYY